MTLDPGTIILVDYTAQIKDADEVFDTTIEENARKHNIYEPDTYYQPRLITVGERHMLKGFDDEIVNANVGEPMSIEVLPDKGFGERDPGKVRMIPLRKLGEDAEKVFVGDTITIDGRNAIVRFIGSGRVQVDFNHHYAGETIVYDVNVIKSLDSDEDKLLYTARHHFGPNYRQEDLVRDENSLNVSIPEKFFRVNDLQTIKHFLKIEIFKRVPSLKTIHFVETHDNPASGVELKPKSDNQDTDTDQLEPGNQDTDTDSPKPENHDESTHESHKHESDNSDTKPYNTNVEERRT